MGRNRDWILEPKNAWWVEEYDCLPFRTTSATKGYPTREAAESRRAVVLADLKKNWDFCPELHVVARGEQKVSENHK